MTGTTTQPPPAAVAPWQRLGIAQTDAERVIHIQDLATVRDPAPQIGAVAFDLGDDCPQLDIPVLDDEAIIVITVRRSELWELAACIVPLLGPIEGGR